MDGGNRWEETIPLPPRQQWQQFLFFPSSVSIEGGIERWVKPLPPARKFRHMRAKGALVQHFTRSTPNLAQSLINK